MLGGVGSKAILSEKVRGGVLGGFEERGKGLTRYPGEWESKQTRVRCPECRQHASPTGGSVSEVLGQGSGLPGIG